MNASTTSRVREIIAGLVGSIGTVPLAIANGAVAFAPLGGKGAVAGAVGALVAVGLSGAVLGTLSGSKPMAAAPSAALSLTVAGVLTAAIRTGAIGDPAELGTAGLGAAVALSAILAISAAVLIAIVAAMRLGRLAAFVPYPVLAGFFNGTALLLALSQLGPIVGTSLGQSPAHADWRPLAPLVVLVGLASMALPLPGVLLRLPILLRGVCGAWAMDAVLRAAGFAASLGPLLGAPPDLTRHMDNFSAGLAALTALPLAPLIPTLAAGAATIAVLSIIETLGAASALRELGQPRADLDRDLLALSAANLASGLAGAQAVAGSVTASTICFRAGGRGSLAVLARATSVIAVLALLGPLVALAPQAAFSTVLLGIAWAVSDAGTLRALRGQAARHRVADAAVMVVVAAVAVAWSLAAAVAIGMFLSVLAFTASMARGVVRRSWRNPGGRSRTRRPPWAEAILLEAGQDIEVVELEGALFFGSAEAVALHVEGTARTGARFIVLDLTRVTRVDLSGGRQLLRLARQALPGARLLLSGLRPGCPAYDDLEVLALHGRLPVEASFDSLETALEWVEDVILTDAAEGRPTAAADAGTLLERLGLSREQAERLLVHMHQEGFTKDMAVIRQGGPPDAMYLLVSGTADVAVARPGTEGVLRITTLTPGAMFGEMALLTGQARSADVRARSPLVCLKLDREGLIRLEREEPAVAFAFLRAIARQLDSNLRMANTTILSLDR